jgi:hypothetical protein
MRHVIAIPGSLSLIKDEDMLLWNACAAAIRRNEFVQVADEYGTLQRILENGDQRAVPREECGFRTLRTMFVHDAEPDECLARSRHASDEDEPPTAILARAPNQFMDAGDHLWEPSR